MVKKLVGLTAIAIVLLAGCHGRHETTGAVKNEEPSTPSAPVSSIKMNDPETAGQLVRGFYPIEGSMWRWTAGSFSIALHPPEGAAQKGATLILSFNIPVSVLDKLKDVTLTASVDGKQLKSQKYTSAGNATFSADIPAAVFSPDKADKASFDFSLDKSLPPGPADRRELGIIATAAGLESN